MMMGRSIMRGSSLHRLAWILISHACVKRIFAWTSKRNPSRLAIPTLPLEVDLLPVNSDRLRVPPDRCEPPLRRDAFVRGLVGGVAGLCTTSSFVTAPPTSLAFDNKISTAYDDRPKRRGPKPVDLGVRVRQSFNGYEDDYVGLKGCGPGPDCFSSTLVDDEDHVIPAWTWPAEYDPDRALDDLEEVLKAYPPGQGGVDGGGFQIQAFDRKNGYAYVQYEALKNGYIDDVEFAIIPGYPDRSLQVRSSSRVGYLDYGVNAKRLNWIAAALREKGWNAVGVDYRTHPFYAQENQVAEK